MAVDNKYKTNSSINFIYERKSIFSFVDKLVLLNNYTMLKSHLLPISSAGLITTTSALFVELTQVALLRKLVMRSAGDVVALKLGVVAWVTSELLHKLSCAVTDVQHSSNLMLKLSL